MEHCNIKLTLITVVNELIRLNNSLKSTSGFLKAVSEAHFFCLSDPKAKQIKNGKPSVWLTPTVCIHDPWNMVTVQDY